MTKSRVGEKRLMNNGQWAEIISYRSCHSIDVRFDSGVIAKDREYAAFKKGKVSENTRKRNAKHYAPIDHIGEEGVTRHGEKMRIIAWRKTADIDIEFEDGYTAKHRNYREFRKGNIGKKKERIRGTSRIGETKMMRCGLRATIVEWKSPSKQTTTCKVSLEFEDGVVVRYRDLSQWLNCAIAHPAIKAKEYHGFTQLSKSFSLSDGRTFYMAVSPNGEKNLWTPQQMMEWSR